MEFQPRPGQIALKISALNTAPENLPYSAFCAPQVADILTGIDLLFLEATSPTDGSNPAGHRFFELRVHEAHTSSLNILINVIPIGISEAEAIAKGAIALAKNDGIQAVDVFFGVGTGIGAAFTTVVGLLSWLTKKRKDADEITVAKLTPRIDLALWLIARALGVHHTLEIMGESGRWEMHGPTLKEFLDQRQTGPRRRLVEAILSAEVFGTMELRIGTELIVADIKDTAFGEWLKEYLGVLTGAVLIATLEEEIAGRAKVTGVEQLHRNGRLLYSINGTKMMSAKPKRK